MDLLAHWLLNPTGKHPRQTSRGASEVDEKPLCRNRLPESSMNYVGHPSLPLTHQEAEWPRSLPPPPTIKGLPHFHAYTSTLSRTSPILTQLY